MGEGALLMGVKEFTIDGWSQDVENARRRCLYTMMDIGMVTEFLGLMYNLLNTESLTFLVLDMRFDPNPRVNGRRVETPSHSAFLFSC